MINSLIFLLLAAPAQEANTAQEAETISLEEVRQWLSTFRAEQRRAPTLAEFDERTSLPSGVVGLAGEARRPALEAFANAQEPMISVQDLIELVTTTRTSINDLHMKVELKQFEFKEGQRKLTSSSGDEFAFSGRKTLLKRVPGGEENWSIMAYDEDVQRSYQEKGKATLGSVQQYGGRSPFFRPESNLLFGSMLLDSVDCAQTELPFHDLVLLLGQGELVITEQLMDRDGTQCLVAGNPGLEVWMDPLRNFSVLYFVHYYHPNDGPRKVSYECVLEDLVDCGNGVWFPQKMTRRMYSKTAAPGTLEKEDVATVVDLSVNKPLPDGLFTEIIPEGTIVLDQLKDLTYRSGVEGSIQEVLDGQIDFSGSDSKESNLLFWNCLVLVLIVGVYGAYYLRKRSRA